MSRSRLAGTASLASVVASAMLSGAACGGSEDTPGLDGGGHAGDDATAGTKTGSTGGPDATSKESDADAGATAAMVTDASDELGPGVTFEAGPFPGLDPTPSGTKLCEIDWPIPNDGTFLLDTTQVAVDSTNGIYVAFQYNEPNVDGLRGGKPLFDAGAPDEAVGVAVAKIDPSCNVLWMRELGSSVAGAVAGGFVDLAGMALDSASDVTLAGSLRGPATLGSATLDAGGYAYGDAGSLKAVYDAFVIRFDTNGNEVFSKVITSTNDYVSIDSMGVDSAGTTTLLAYGNPDVDFGAGPTPGDGSTVLTVPYPDGVVPYIVQLDGAGSVVSQVNYPPADVTLGAPYRFLWSDPGGHLYATSRTSFDGGGDLVLAHLGADAGIAYETDYAPPMNVSANASGQVAAYGGGAGGWEGISPPSMDGGGFGPAVLTDTAFSLDSNKFQVVVDPQGRVIVGNEFYGTLTTEVDGAVNAVGEPKGAGFQAFDESGALASVSVRGSAEKESFQAIGVGPDSNIVLVGTTGPVQDDHPNAIFLLRMAR
jgi:hypothetical protein